MVGWEFVGQVSMIRKSYGHADGEACPASQEIEPTEEMRVREDPRGPGGPPSYLVTS